MAAAAVRAARARFFGEDSSCLVESSPGLPLQPQGLGQWDLDCGCTTAGGALQAARLTVPATAGVAVHCDLCVPSRSWQTMARAFASFVADVTWVPALKMFHLFCFSLQVAE